jgi:hypothetical protein
MFLIRSSQEPRRHGGTQRRQRARSSRIPYPNAVFSLNRNFAIGLLVTFFMGMLAFTSLVLLPHPVA